MQVIFRVIVLKIIAATIFWQGLYKNIDFYRFFFFFAGLCDLLIRRPVVYMAAKLNNLTGPSSAVSRYILERIIDYILKCQCFQNAVTAKS